jgi:hypothetical protein
MSCGSISSVCSTPAGARIVGSTSRSSLVQQRRAGRLHLEMEPVVALEPEHRRFRRSEQAHLHGGLAGLEPAQRDMERCRQSLGESAGGFLVLATDDEPGEPLVGRIVVRQAVRQFLAWRARRGEHGAKVL